MNNSCLNKIWYCKNHSYKQLGNIFKRKYMHHKFHIEDIYNRNVEKNPESIYIYIYIYIYMYIYIYSQHWNVKYDYG